MQVHRTLTGDMSQDLRMLSRKTASSQGNKPKLSQVQNDRDEDDEDDEEDVSHMIFIIICVAN